jgi:hypothetical protein
MVIKDWASMGRYLLGRYPEVVWRAKFVVRDNCFLHTEEEAVEELCSVVRCLLRL